MRSCAIPAVAALAGLSALVDGQSFTNDSHITFGLTWSEATSSGAPVPSPNGFLEPGESALITVTPVSFTNQFGVANFFPAIGTFTSGTILGFGSAFFDLAGQPGLNGTQGTFNNNNPPANAGGTSGFGIRADYRLVDNGFVNPGSDSVINLQPGQIPSAPGAALRDNPVTNLFRVLWQPTSFAQRTAHFYLTLGLPENAGASVYVDLNGTLGAQVYANRATGLTWGSINIPIVPAPASLALPGLATFFAARRRH